MKKRGNMSDNQPLNSNDVHRGAMIPVKISSNTNINSDVATASDLIKDTTEDEASKYLSSTPINIEYADLSHVAIPKEILNLVPEHIARRFQSVPVKLDGNTLTVAMIDPQDIETIELIKRKTGYEVSPQLTTQDDINHVLDQYTGLQAEVQEAIDSADLRTDSQEAPQKATEVNFDDQEAPTSRVVYSLLKRAVREKASDIHIEPEEHEVSVRFRLDGVLHKKISLPKEIQAAVISRLKILANLKIDEQRVPQDGRIQLTIDKREIDFRISTIPLVTGEKIVLRILDKSVGILTLDQLGLRGESRKSLENGISKSHGMTLITGPTGSGKTTSLYAILGELINPGVNIVTLEDPVEYRMLGINQSQINTDVGYSFASGLRAILRQDPNIVMVGEIRDKETAEMGIQAALTGHIVLSTLHTNDAAGAIPRLIDMDVEAFLITSSINTVVAQRLARKTCESCKEKYQPSTAEIEMINNIIAEMPEETKKSTEKRNLDFYYGQGCDECNHTGYKGRIGIFEVLSVDDDLKAIILGNVSSETIRKKAIANGMITMIQDGILKALDGITTLEEVWRVTKE